MKRFRELPLQRGIAAFRPESKHPSGHKRLPAIQWRKRRSTLSRHILIAGIKADVGRGVHACLISILRKQAIFIKAYLGPILHMSVSWRPAPALYA